MALDNVVPIDAEAARLLHRRNLRFRWFVAGLAAAWLSVLVPVLVFTPLPPGGLFVVLAVLVVLAEHRFVLFGDETSMSASIVVVVASVFLFADSSPLAGPMLIASLGGLYLPHLVRGERGKAAFNGIGMSLSAMASGFVALIATGGTNNPLRISAVVALATCAYWTANNLIVAGYQSVVNQLPFKPTARQLLTSDTEILAWAGVCALGVQFAAGEAQAQLAFLIALVGLRIAVHDFALIPRMSFAEHSRHKTTSARLLVWMAAMSVLAFAGPTGPTNLAFALAITLLVGWLPARESVLAMVAPPILAIAAINSRPTPAAIIPVALLIAIWSGLLNPPKWSWCIALGGVTFAVVSGTGALHGIMTSNAYSEVATETALPCVLAAGLFALSVLRTMDTPHLSVALGVVSPTVRDIAALAGVSAVGFAGQSDFNTCLVAVTILFVGSATLESVNARRSSQAASR